MKTKDLVLPVLRRLQTLGKLAYPLIALVVVCARAQAVPPGPTAAPEVDPGSIASALTLLAGGVLLLTGRRRRQ